MIKSTIAIADDVLKYVKQTSLVTSVNGVCRADRPIPVGSDKEDIWIKCISKQDGEIEKAIVIVNVYVPDQYNSEEQQWELNRARIRTLAAICDTIFDYVSVGSYHFEKQTQNIEAVQDINKHFISNRLLYRHNTNT